MKYLTFIPILFLYTSLGFSGSARIIVHDREHMTIVNDIALQRIFTLSDTHWPNGDNIKVYIRTPDSIEHKQFVAEVLNMSLYTYNKMLDTKLYTSNKNTINVVHTKEQMISAISKNRGSIGYIDGVVVRNGSKVMVVDDVFNN